MQHYQNSYLLTGIPSLGFLQLIWIVVVSGQIENNYSSKEKAAIEKLRPMVTQYLTKDFMKVDSYLLRWIKSADFDLERAKDKLERLYKWRHDNKIDNILREDLRAFEKCIPIKLKGFDKEGVPVLEVHLGKWALRKYIVAGKREQFISAWYHALERANEKMYETEKKLGKEISQFNIIEDFDGFSIREHACLACTSFYYEITRSIAIGQIYFIKSATLINVPRAFLPILAVIKSLLPEETSRKVHDYGHNKEEWMAHLFKNIEKDQLPEIYGGTRGD